MQSDQQATPPWIDFRALRERLLRAGIAPKHARELVFEWRAHFLDATAAGRAHGLSPADSAAHALEQLGSADSLLAGALARPELQSWARRRPALAFVLLPLIAFSCAFVLAATLLALAKPVLEPVAWAKLPSPNGWRLAADAYELLVQWGLPLATASVAWLLALQRRTPLLWPTIGVLIVSTLGALTNFSIVLPTAQSPGSLSAGIGFGTTYALAIAARVVLSAGAAYLAYRWLRRAGLSAAD